MQNYVGSRVRGIRTMRGLSQAELGERVGLGRDAITKIEQGQRKLSLHEAIVIAHSMDVSVAELAGVTDSPYEQGQPTGAAADLRFEVSVRLLPSRKEESAEALPAIPPWEHEPQEPPSLAREVAKHPEVFARALETNPELLNTFPGLRQAVADVPALRDLLRLVGNKQAESGSRSGARKEKPS